MLVNRKIKDSDIGISSGSRADRYWQAAGFKSLYKQLRSPELRASSEDPYKTVSTDYGVRAIEFGNWVPIDMRYNYLIGCIIALHDINLATGLKSFGFKTLSLSFGARGMGKALAHYEPGAQTINITRYAKDTGRDGFTYTGGVGALAHEYGHFLDYFFGAKVKNNSGSRALSGGQQTTFRFTEAELKDPGPWGCMSRLLKAIMINDKGQKSDYLVRIRKIGGDYWYRRNEIFARTFEQYIQYKLEKRSIRNKFLTQHKYESRSYMRPEEFKKILPLMDKFMQSIRKA